MKRSLLLIILACLTLSVWGQPPSVEIITPVSGYYAIVQPDQGLFLVDTSNGNLEQLVSSPIASNPVWANHLSHLAYTDQGRLRSIDIETMTIKDIIDTPQSLDIAYSWNYDDSQILHLAYYLGEQAIDIVDINTNVVIDSLFQFRRGDPVYDFSTTHIPWANSTLVYTVFDTAKWNPTYSDWLLLRVRTMSTDPSAINYGNYSINVLFNIDTREIISLDETLGLQIQSDWLSWHANGKHILLYSYSTDDEIIVDIAEFLPESHQVTLVDQALSELETNPVEWAGISDLFISVGTSIDGKQIVYLNLLNNQRLYTQEILQLDAIYQGGTWKFTGTPEEAAQISCIFDETLPTRLEIGVQAQVAFTDGTPSRLRSEPSTWGDVVQSLPEGTAFEIIGGYMCGSGYRWWQVQLADGTQGWIAEASETEYWISP